MILISPTAVQTIYSSPRVIFCHQKLFESFQAAVTTSATVIRYRGDLIGEQGEGTAIAIDQFGLPVGLEMIHAPADCPTARKITQLALNSGFPREIPVVEPRWAPWTPKSSRYGAIREAYLRAHEASHQALQEHCRARESEVVALRRKVESQTLANNHLKGFLNMLGYASQELFIEEVPDRVAAPLSPPFERHLPVLLSDVAGISVFATSSNPGRARLKLLVGRSFVHEQEIQCPRGAGWQDIYFPEGFASINQDAVLIIEAIDSQTGFAPTGNGQAAIRIWRHEDARLHPVRSRAGLSLPHPVSVRENVLEAHRLMAAVGWQAIENFVGLVDGAFVQTHPIAGEFSNYVVRDLVLGDVESIEADISLDHVNATDVNFLMILLPQADDTQLYSRLLRAAKAGETGPEGRMQALRLSRKEHSRLVIDTAGLDPALPYSLILAAEPAEEEVRFGWAKWRTVWLNLRAAPHRQTYRYSTLASLANLIGYADGPIVEQEMNRRLGFAILSATDGDPYLQTHPVEGQVVAAHLGAFVPKGMQRFWIEISNDHESASDTEFGVLVTPDVVSENFTSHFARHGLEALADDRLHRLQDGSYLKKTNLRAAERATLDVFLTQPLARHSHLYLYVRPCGNSVAYGWCRWHRLAMTILSEVAPESGGN
jgi:hypothetical protein